MKTTATATNQTHQHRRPTRKPRHTSTSTIHYSDRVSLCVWCTDRQQLAKGKEIVHFVCCYSCCPPYHFSTIPSTTGQRWCCGDHGERHLLPVSFQGFCRVIAGGGFVPPHFTSFKLCPPLCNFIALLAPSSPRLLPQFAFVMDSISSGDSSSSVLGAIGSHVDAMSEVSAQEPFFSRRCPLSLPLAHFNCRRDD